MLAVAPPFSHSITTTTTSPTTASSTTDNNRLTKSATTLPTTTTTTPRNPSFYDSKNMLPSPPATHQSLAPPSPPSLDLEPSPVYSPLSTPSHSPKPPPSPPLAATGDTYSWDDRVRCSKQQELRNKEKLRGRAAAPGVDKAAADLNDRTAAAAAATAPMTTAPPNNPTTTTPTASSRTSTDVDDGALSPDAIALSSTRRLLDLQLARAKRDIVTLAEMRESALKEPLQFVEYIASTGPRGGRAASSKKSSSESLKNNVFADKEIPKPQEVYRCPHIEWSKYHILGAPLDSLHEKQRRRPSPSQPVGYNGPHGVPPSMQTGGLISREYADSLVGDSGIMQGRLRLFDGISAQRCVGR